MSCQAILKRDASLFASTQESKRISSRLTSTDYMTNNRSPAFTLIEMIVVLAVIAIMMALVYPAYTTISERAKAIKDMSNLRQIGMLMQTYLNDSDQVLPPSTTWPGTSPTPSPAPSPGQLYPKYVGTRKIFQSPFDKRTPSEASDGTPPISYSINTNVYGLVGGSMLKVVSPASTFFMAPNYSGNPASSGSWTGTAGNAPDLPVGGGAGETTGTHSSGTKINVLFCDWHTETLTFGPNGSPAPGSFKDTSTDPLGQKHWNPTK
jgi:prepilin-type N-terminal cleavage/methylation domain-containing protein/prepilin-type processing-associated H-X9-DG protein